jgi:hypothetical protein
MVDKQATNCTVVDNIVLLAFVTLQSHGEGSEL